MNEVMYGDSNSVPSIEEIQKSVLELKAKDRGTQSFNLAHKKSVVPQISLQTQALSIDYEAEFLQMSGSLSSNVEPITINQPN